MVANGAADGVIFPEEDDIFNIHAKCNRRKQSDRF